MINHTEHGMHCACWHWMGSLLWLAALLSLILAWITGPEANFSGLDQGELFVNAMVLGILAIPLKLKGHAGGCECNMCKPSRR